MSEKPVILLGAGGHAKVVLDVLLATKRNVIGVCDPLLAKKGITSWRGLTVLGDDSAIEHYAAETIELANGTGSLPGNVLRRTLHHTFIRQGYTFATVVHPTAILGTGVRLGQGVQVMAGAIVQADTQVGDNVIINTGVYIDHEAHIGSNVHLAPGVVLSGNVMIADDVHIGPNATIIQGINIAEGAVVGAGTTVLSDIPAHYQQTSQPPRKPQPFQSFDQETEI